ncbi:ferredoxin [Flammeovirga sp. SJP92]|uniref:(2Fe-2S) ferredoxin domain-containing protein n=1 Tax=Flammeovirga sp. SJP92 TaxID=1775430 RepID=UPI0007879B68|nr:(2Fe-2S) ferredoxin domain-containing protein [Flammeovirga sp. SJP92]KXX68398.1 hypothetical protein AVL50_21765 [Flammeovirga sp. SJP92]
MGKNIAETQQIFLFCDGGSCQKAGSEEVVRNVRAYLRNSGQWDSTHTIKTRCNGRCEDAPTCIVQPNYWYKDLNPQKGLEIIKSHIENQEPVTDYLLYQDEWSAIKSDKEREAFTPKPFSIKIDPDLGECRITRGFASDQYTFPLFLYLSENSPKSTLTLSGQTPLSFSEIKSVNYSQKYTLELELESETIELIIAPIDQKNQELVKKRIAVVEYFEQLDSLNKGVRMRNKFGEDIGLIWLEDHAWQYCLEVQLKGIKLETV